jgi:imidazole glycerol-phosphate synthase subunit HisH
VSERPAAARLTRSPPAPASATGREAGEDLVGLASAPAPAPPSSPRPSIAVVDYGMGNRRSVEKALQRVGADAFVSRDHGALRQADGLLLPGVGAFPAAMAEIERLALDDLLRERAHAGVPLFGSCMGMQLLFEGSEEHGGARGLSLLRGQVRRLQADGLKLPHIGWSEVTKQSDSPLWSGLPERIFLYHVHSYVPHPNDPQTVVGTAEYGQRFPALVAYRNVYGAQSHPEKSSTQGLALLANFVSICAARRAGEAEVAR